MDFLAHRIDLHGVEDNRALELLVVGLADCLEIRGLVRPYVIEAVQFVLAFLQTVDSLKIAGVGQANASS